MLDLHGGTGREAVRALHQRLLFGCDAIIDPPRLLAGVLDRMVLAPVCIASDVALPHARSNSVSRMVLAVGRSDEDIAFDEEHPSVRLVFLIGTPRDAMTGYLQAVAALARVLRQPSTRAGLFAAVDVAGFRSVLSSGVAARR